MAEKETIFVDVDDVCALLMTGWLAKYNAEYNDCLTKAQINDWDMTKHVKPECGRDIYKYLHDKTLYDAVPPIEGALEGVRKLCDLGLRVVFATASNIHMAGRKAHWLEEHGFLKEPMRHGTVTHEFVELQDKSLLRGWALLDDGPHNLQHFVGHRLLMTQAHNATLDTSDNGFIRVYDWFDAVEQAQFLLQKKV